MLTDKELYFSNAQNMSDWDEVAPDPSTNEIDLGSVFHDVGNGTPVAVVVQIKTAMVSAAGGPAAVAVTIQASNTSGSYSGSVATVGTFAAASAAGTRLVYVIPPEMTASRYIRVLYTADDALHDSTGGVVDAFLSVGYGVWAPAPMAPNAKLS